MDVQKVLDEIADDIEANGHLQDTYVSTDADKGSVCLVSNHVRGRYMRVWGPVKAELERRTEVDTSREYALIYWNDSHSTEEVLAMLRGTS